MGAQLSGRSVVFGLNSGKSLGRLNSQGMFHQTLTLNIIYGMYASPLLKQDN